MADTKDTKQDSTSLLDAVVGLLNSQREGNMDTNTLVSLLTLCNLLGIISFLNNQVGLNINLTAGQSTKSSDKAALASSLLSMMNSKEPDSKFSPQMLLPLLKAFNSGPGGDGHPEKHDQKKEIP